MNNQIFKVEYNTDNVVNKLTMLANATDLMTLLLDDDVNIVSIKVEVEE